MRRRNTSASRHERIGGVGVVHVFPVRLSEGSVLSSSEQCYVVCRCSFPVVP